MATKQETFDTVVGHLRRQGCKALDEDGCAYRGENGTKCAAGCLVPDNKYQPGYEGPLLELIDTEVGDEPTKIGQIIIEEGHDLSFVNELQLIHDKNEVEHWEIYFSQLATKHGLTYTPPTAAATA